MFNTTTHKSVKFDLLVVLVLSAKNLESYMKKTKTIKCPSNVGETSYKTMAIEKEQNFLKT